MKKLTKIIMAMFIVVGQTINHSSAQDSTKSVVSADKFKTELSLLSRNVFRGVGYGDSPSILMMGSWVPCEYTEIGVYGNVTMNGLKEGFGNQINSYITIKPFAKSDNELKNISLTSDDYYYFYSVDSMNNFFAKKNKKTNHFMEARIKYDGRIDFTVAYTYWGNKNADIDGVYFEGGYDISPVFYVFAGYLTDRNDLMFQTKGGWTNLGATLKRKLHIKDWSPELNTSVIISPTYQTVANFPGVGKNPISLVASLKF